VAAGDDLQQNCGILALHAGTIMIHAPNAHQTRHRRRGTPSGCTADRVTAALAQCRNVEAIALMGSVARPLRQEVPRFAPYRQLRVAIAHECKDVDLAVWVSRLNGLDDTAARAQPCRRRNRCRTRPRPRRSGNRSLSA
jgi:hypothetical protein